MTPDDLQQAREIIEKYQDIYICIPVESSDDVVLGAVGLASVLKKAGKSTTLVSEVRISDRIKPLIAEAEFTNLPFSSDKLVVDLDTSRSGLGQLNYEVHENKVSIFLKSKDGNFTVNDITVTPYLSSNALIVTLGAGNPEELGEIFATNSNIFYKLPKLNIDTNLSNERYGNLNLVVPSASSVCEILTNLIDQGSLAESINEGATAFLAGILFATSGLKNNKTTPDSFSVSSRLVGVGANHSLAASTLFKSIGFPEIKLLGKILADMEFHNELGIGFVVLERAQMRMGMLGYARIEEVIPELALNIGEVSGVMIFDIQPEGVTLYLVGNIPSDIVAKFVKDGGNKLKQLPHILPLSQKLELNMEVLEIKQKLGDISSNVV